MYQIIIQLPDRAPISGRLVNGVYHIGSSSTAHIQINKPDIEP